LKIEIIGVTVENKGKFRMATIAYKGPDGKPDGKKIPSFANKEVFNTLSTAQQGDIFDVKSQKNAETGYWDWVEVSQAGKNTGAEAGSPRAVASAARSNYETPEERAKRQVYIVRQSSISAAVELAKLQGETEVVESDIIESARKFEAYVFGIGEAVEPLKEVEVK
jgi:hypothetical protein